MFEKPPGNGIQETKLIPCCRIKSTKITLYFERNIGEFVLKLPEENFQFFVHLFTVNMSFPLDKPESGYEELNIDLFNLALLVN